MVDAHGPANECSFGGAVQVRGPEDEVFIKPSDLRHVSGRVLRDKLLELFESSRVFLDIFAIDQAGANQHVQTLQAVRQKLSKFG